MLLTCTIVPPHLEGMDRERSRMALFDGHSHTRIILRIFFERTSLGRRSCRSRQLPKRVMTVGRGHGVRWTCLMCFLVSIIMSKYMYYVSVPVGLSLVHLPTLTIPYQRSIGAMSVTSPQGIHSEEGLGRSRFVAYGRYKLHLGT